MAIEGPITQISWRKSIEPHASAWKLLEETARSIGLVHALDALTHLRDPADCADLAAEMVQSGILCPIKIDLAHPRYGHSIRAFRGLMYAGRKIEPKWCPAEAHLYTYEIIRET